MLYRRQVHMSSLVGLEVEGLESCWIYVLNARFCWVRSTDLEMRVLVVVIIMHMCTCSVAQLCLTLCGPKDWGLPGSPVHRIFQARLLESVAVSSSRGILLIQISNLHLLHLLHYQVDSYH